MIIPNKLQSETLLAREPLGYIDSETLFLRPTSEYESEYLIRPDSEEPVDVVVNSATARMSQINGSSTANINYALSLNSSVQSYLEDALSVIDELQGLAETAAEDTTTDSDRADVNTQASALLDKLDSYFDNAQFNGEYIMRGGSTTLAVGNNGEEVQINFGNLYRTYLGLNSFDLSSQAGAEAASEALDRAQSKVEVQLATAEDQSENLNGYYVANTSSLVSVQNVVETGVSQEYAVTALENSKAAIQNKMIFATGIQGANIRDATISTMTSELEKLSERIKTVQEDAAEAEEEQKGEEELAAAQEFQSVQKKESEEIKAFGKADDRLVESVSANMPDPAKNKIPILSEADDYVKTEISPVIPQVPTPPASSSASHSAPASHSASASSNRSDSGGGNSGGNGTDNVSGS